MNMYFECRIDDCHHKDVVVVADERAGRRRRQARDQGAQQGGTAAGETGDLTTTIVLSVAHTLYPPILACQSRCTNGGTTVTYSDVLS